MAERRMFAKTIIDSDAFIDMPLSTQALYFHLSMRADDDGFINNPKKIQRMVGASDDDLKVLVMKRFIIPFESGIVVIKHWKIHNYIRNDRYKPTVYVKEKSMLSVKENGGYTEVETNGIPTVNQVGDKWDAQVSIGKDRLELGKDRVVECSISTDCDTDLDDEEAKRNELHCIGGTLGQGVVFLSDNQMDALIDKLGLDAYDRYLKRLSDYIIEKNAYVKNHYETILKWYKQDTKV